MYCPKRRMTSAKATATGRLSRPLVASRCSDTEARGRRCPTPPERRSTCKRSPHRLYQSTPRAPRLVCGLSRACSWCPSILASSCSYSLCDEAVTSNNCLYMDNRLSPNLLRSEQIVPELPSILSPDGLSYSLAVADHPTVLVPSISRLASPVKLTRPKRRPSTASSAKDKHDLLPPASSMGDWSPSAHLSASYPEGSSRTGLPDAQENKSAPSHRDTFAEMNRKVHAAVAGLRAEAFRLAGTGACLGVPAS